jgi:putative DNA primase/helicase
VKPGGGHLPGMSTSSHHGTPAAEVAARLADSIADLTRHLTGTEPTSRNGHELRWRGKGSLGVHASGPKRGWFHDNEADKHGDALALVAHLRGCSMREAYHWALAWLGMKGGQSPRQAPRRPEPPPDPPQRPPETDRAKVELAAGLWREARPAAGSPVERYLGGRGLTLPPDAPLRFHPACPRSTERLPAMVALMSDPATGQPCGVHRTFLAPDGAGKAPGKTKMMLGGAGVVRLVPDAEVTAALGIAEGIETALAVMQRYGWAPVWAAGSAGGIKRLPVLVGIEALTVFPDADDDGASMDAAQECAARWQAAGREVQFLTPPAGADFADLAERVA